MMCSPRSVRCLRFVLSTVGLLYLYSAHADGIYIPPDAVEILPEIPHQRAVIVWRDGVEQLLVESDFDGAGERMAWIVPVPDEPSDVGVGAPGVFDVLERGLAPETVQSHPALFALALFLLLWCVCQWALGVYAPKRAIKYTVACFAIFYFLFMTTPIDFVTLGDSMGGGPGLNDGAEVLTVRSVGSYEVTTLRVTKTEELSQWLSQNGFRGLPEAGETIVSEYIAEGWCFVAAKLQRNGTGYTRPHPLSITFATDTPVYPMRLTRLADTDLFLDLYVIAERRAKAPEMETVYCERFRRGEDNGVEKVWGTRYSEADTDSFLFQPVEAGNRMGLHNNRTMMALPWLVERMHDGDIVTHLRAKVPVDTMHEDVQLDFRWFARTRPRLQIPEERKEASIGYALCAFGLVLGLGLLTHYERVSRKKTPVKKRIALLLAFSSALVASQYPAWTTTPGNPKKYDPYDRRSMELEKVVEALGDHPTILEEMDKTAIEAWILECLTYPKAGKIAAEDFLGEGPGRFEIIEDERGTLLRTYGENNDFFSSNLGLPLEYPLLTPEGKASNEARSGWMPEEPFIHIAPRSALSFDYVAPGQRKFLPVTLSNKGGPVVAGYIKADPPYYVREEHVKYTLKPGTSVEVEIEYRPEHEGLHEVTIDFIGNDSRKLRVYRISYHGQPATEGIHLDDNRILFRRDTDVRNSSLYRMYYVVLRNENAFPVDLKGWGISNDPLEPYKHTFSENTVIAPEDYTVVYLLSEPLQPGAGYSVGFELQSSTKGYLGLSNPHGKLVSNKNYKLIKKEETSRGY